MYGLYILGMKICIQLLFGINIQQNQVFACFILFEIKS